MDELILKFLWKCKRSTVAKTLLERTKLKDGHFRTSDFRAYHKATAIKTVRCWPKDRHTDRRNRNGNPRSAGSRRVSRASNGAKKLLSANGAEQPHAKLAPHVKINSKWVTHLNGRAKTIKLRRKHRSNSSWALTRQWYLRTPKAQAKTKNKLVFIKI